ncbi:MAG TPA: Demethylmenaquinone methyltransferase, partial [Megasphaera sp.]|nr:Demethylmenaquinone methyltransferase [Megasphaera sp.]
AIKAAEERQAKFLKEGKSLRDQLHFKEYLARHSVTPSYSFRDHLRKIGGAIEQ